MSEDPTLLDLVELHGDHGEPHRTELHDVILDQVNGGLTHPDRLGKKISEDHHTLQTYVFKQIVKPIILNLAKADTSERNEDAVAQCQQIVEDQGWDDEDYPYSIT